MIEYECFDFSTFCLNHQISNLLEFLNTLDGIEGQIEAFEHFLPVFPKAASRKDTVFFIQIIPIMHRDLKLSDVFVSKQHYCKKISVRINGRPKCLCRLSSGLYKIIFLQRILKQPLKVRGNVNPEQNYI